MNNLEGFSIVRVLVIGDIMLDRYWWGTVNRISPEAPVPVVHLKKRTFAAGGAANVAANVAGLGAKPILIGIVGQDEEAEQFKQVLSETHVSSDFLVLSDDRPTIIKTRVIAHSQQVLRVDQEETIELTKSECEQIWRLINDKIEDVDIIIVSDYAKGLFTENLLSRLITLATQKNKPLVVDPKGKNYTKYAGSTLITPNRKEAAEACNLDENSRNLVEIAGAELLSRHLFDSVLITQGEDGMTLFQKEKQPKHLPASAREIYDVTGAGDTVIAALAVSVGAGANLETAAEIANTAAGLVVEQVGTTVITSEMLRQYYKN